MAFNNGKARYSAHKKTLCNKGHSHRSKLESDVCDLIEPVNDLLLLQVEDHVYMTRARMLYIPDFKVQRQSTGEIFWIEAKGNESAGNWSRNQRLWKFYGPGKLEVWKATRHGKPYHDRTIVPEPSQDSGEAP